MAMGYQGLAQIEITRDGTTGFVPLLVEGASINLVLDPIYSEAVWGAGWYNAATNVNYADNAVRYEGSMDFQLQASANIWNLIRDWAIENRAFSRAARITPDASWIYYYGPGQLTPDDYNAHGTGGTTGDIYTTQGRGRMGLWCRGMSLNTSTGSFVTGSLDCIALFRQVMGPAGTQPAPTSATTWGAPFDPELQSITDPGQASYIDDKYGISGPNNPLNPIHTEFNNEPNYDPIPYWRTLAFLKRNDGTSWNNMQVNGTDLETVEWSVDLTNNTQVLYTCRGIRGASAILQGAIDATASVTLYNPYGLIDPIYGDGSGAYNEFNPYLIAENTEFLVQISGTDNGAGSSSRLALALPAVVVESDDYGIRGLNDVTNRTYSLKGLGGRLLQDLDSDIPYTPTLNDGSSAYSGSGELSLPPMIMTEA